MVTEEGFPTLFWYNRYKTKYEDLCIYAEGQYVDVVAGYRESSNQAVNHWWQQANREDVSNYLNWFQDYYEEIEYDYHVYQQYLERLEREYQDSGAGCAACGGCGGGCGDWDFC